MGLLDAIQNFGSKVRTASQPFLDVYNTPEFQQQITLGTSLLGGAGVPASIQAANKAGLLAQNTQDLKRQREAIGLLEQQFANNPKMLGLLQANPTGFIRAMTARELLPKDSFELVPQDDLPESLRGKGVFQRNTRTGKIFPIGNTNNTGVSLLNLDDIDKLVPSTEEKIEEVEKTGASFDIGTAAGRDLAGFGTDFANAVTGLFGGSFSKEREKQVAIINSINNTIKQPMIKALSTRGSVFTQKRIEELLPQPTDSNQKFVEKSRQLVPKMQRGLNNLKAKMTAAKTSAELEQLRNDYDEIVGYLANITVAINDYESGSTTNNLLNQADEIVGSAK